MANIAILGWGSLINEPGVLNIEGDWQPGGPVLPIEYSRISKSRDGALTLVIDPVHGTKVETLYIKSGCQCLSDAIDDLRKREGTNNKHIGFVDLLAGESRAGIHDIESIIERWTISKGFDATIWTDLASNFAEKSGFDAFTIQNAIDYLSRLDNNAFEKAIHYFHITPLSIMTGLRLELVERLISFCCKTTYINLCYY